MRVLHRRNLLLGLAALATVAALYAVAVLLVGRFGHTEARILQSTALVAVVVVLALPAAMLADRRRLPGLVAAVAALGSSAALLGLVSLWMRDPPEALGKAFGTTSVWFLAATATAALAARRRQGDPRVVRILFDLWLGLASVTATAVTVLVFTGGSGGAGRAVGALLVLAVLAAVLQPLLSLARTATPSTSATTRKATPRPR